MESGRKKERQMRSGADLKSKGQVKKKRKKMRSRKESGDKKQGERGRVSCVKWINVSGSFIVRLS